MEAAEKDPSEHTLTADDASDRTVVLSKDEAKEDNHTIPDAVDNVPSPSNHDNMGSKEDDESEAFPDYNESCGQFDRGDMSMLLLVKEQEEAYNLALSKVGEEILRYRHVDTRIDTVASRMSDSNQGLIHAQEHPFAVRHWSPQPNEAVETADNSDETRGVYDELREALVHPGLKESTREYFIAMTEMVLSINVLLFPTPTIPAYPTEHLTDLKLVRATNIALHLTEYLLVMKKQLKAHIENVRKVDRSLFRDTRDGRIPTPVMLSHVINVVRKYLNPPDQLEKNLLSLFFELYDTYVYSAFLNMRPLLQTEIDLADEKRELARVLVSLWDVINQDMGKFTEYENRANAIKHRYIDVYSEKLKAESSEMWQEFWVKQRARDGFQVTVPGAGAQLAGSELFIIPGEFI
ncbi:hypothetical protein ANI_1_1570064 [Paecilomyces variotii No. 5]|uniref:Uncharacterized protein n=1 Tax=Byssochlamys spectabilis (strain No. 5 / NBRC 109023) TaxID=1356009 RepID=V5HXB1_BYSSN|nr:hypothetical protein ANI_1_1570064 [Paecilomyces variotii No. 5]